MYTLLGLLILTAGGDASTQERYPGATQVFHVRFDESSDVDYDGWPDGWARRQGPKFPPYVKIGIRDEQAPGGGRPLVIELDGGGGIAYSPLIPAEPHFDYVLEALLKTDGLEHDRAWASITLLDDQRQSLETYASEQVGDTTDWKRLRLGPVSSSSSQIRWAMVAVHLEPGAQQDLKGSARFADLWLGRLPRMSLTLDNALGLVAAGTKVAAKCTVVGPAKEDAPVIFELLDVERKAIARCEQRLAPSAANPLRKTGATKQVYEAHWTPPLPVLGFYVLRATIWGGERIVHRKEVPLVVIQPVRSPPGGEFGWSLPHGHRPLSLSALERLIAQAGIDWVKYPVWIAPDAKETEALGILDFRERLALQGIEMIGLLDRPPGVVSSRFTETSPPTVADVFAASPETWEKTLEPVLSRFGAVIHWWQLGADNDTSFAGYPAPVAKIAEVKGSLDRVGGDAKVGMAWNWMDELPVASHGRKVGAPALAGEGTRNEKPPEGGTPTGRTMSQSPVVVPWRFVSLGIEPPLTEKELAAYLDATRQPGVRRFVSLEPLPRSRYGMADRASDLGRRMIAAKAHGAEGIFLVNPFSTATG